MTKDIGLVRATPATQENAQSVGANNPTVRVRAIPITVKPARGE